MSLQTHLRQTFLAGIFAVIPILVLLIIVYYADHYTRAITQWLFGRDIPFVGVLIALAAVYWVGLATRSIIVRAFIRLFDNIMLRLPLIKTAYGAWKQISYVPGGGEGIFSKVVLIPDESGLLQLAGFSTGETVAPDSDLVAVFLPMSPNPINGRIVFVERSRVKILDVGNEELFKMLISQGNYVPPLDRSLATTPTRLVRKTAATNGHA
jgi:uncharacterized membrane protein